MGVFDFIFGGGGGDAVREAEALEEERRREIAAAQRRVEEIFGSPEREADILGVEDATRAFLQTDLDRKKADTDRNLKFSLARSRLSKGSVDVDLNSRLADDFLRGIFEVERRAKTAGSTLRSQDALSKSGLFSQILGGLDSTLAADQANSALSQNVNQTRNSALQQGVGNFFGDFTDIFKSNKLASIDRRAAFDFNTLYGNRSRGIPSVAGSSLFS